jgi:hypothetical protein
VRTRASTVRDRWLTAWAMAWFKNQVALHVGLSRYELLWELEDSKKEFIICTCVLAGGGMSPTSVSRAALDSCPLKPYFPQKTYLRFDQANLSVILGEEKFNLLSYKGLLWV